MAISAIEAKALIIDGTFKTKVWGAIIRAAYQINGEVASGNSQVDGLRKQLAIAIIQNTDSKLDIFCQGVALFPDFNPQTIDADIDFIIASIFNDIAGA